MNIFKCLVTGRTICQVVTKLLVNLHHTKILLAYIKKEADKLEISYKISPYIDSIITFISTLTKSITNIATIICPSAIDKAAIQSTMSLNESLSILRKRTDELDKLNTDF